MGATNRGSEPMGATETDTGACKSSDDLSSRREAHSGSQEKSWGLASENPLSERRAVGWD